MIQYTVYAVNLYYSYLHSVYILQYQSSCSAVVAFLASHYSSQKTLVSS